ncbi:MAG: GNAT family N-acetyltransferase [Ruminococcaceae bacterium]|nr:GNAT family N-acetyltransferase [Oscillospiraceae bacterium]
MRREAVLKIFSEIPTLSTERLTLRALCPVDAEDMFEYSRRGDLTEYLLWSPHESLAYTREYLKYVGTRYAVGDFYDWAVVLRESGKMIGTCGFTRIDTVNEWGEIGYVLNPDYHGRGYATEAARAVLDFGFRRVGLHRVEARFMEGNSHSESVMKRLGMSFEGYERESIFVKGRYRTVGKYAILAEEYKNEG